MLWLDVGGTVARLREKKLGGAAAGRAWRPQLHHQSLHVQLHLHSTSSLLHPELSNVLYINISSSAILVIILVLFPGVPTVTVVPGLI